MVIMNTTQNIDGTNTQLYRGSSGNQVPGVTSQGDETLMVGISPDAYKSFVRLGQDGIFYRQTIQAGGVEAWVQA